jgi:outer membrane lipoprotein-sorting protein
MPEILLSFCAFLWLIPLAQGQSAFTLNQVFAKMDDVSKTFHSVQSDLERTRVTVIVNDKDVSTGKFYYERLVKEPRLKMDLLKPEQHLLIDKGKWQLYEPNIKQVKQGPLAGHEDQVETFMSLGFGQSSQDLKQNFDVSLVGDATVDGRKTTVLELKPKTSKVFKSIQMWIDQEKWITYQSKFTETSNDYSILKFSNAKINGAIPPSTFDLRLPKNVNVLK